MSTEILRYEERESVAILHFDDGKANALSPNAVKELGHALDRVEKSEAKALVLVGRPGRFSAGFDLSVMGQGGEAVLALVSAGAELALRLYAFPKPVVVACSGHALAMGSILCLSADYRVGVEGPFKIGLNEVAIGMTLPFFGVELAKERLSRRHLGRAVASAEIYSPEGAVDAGFLDRTVPAESLLDEAVAEAIRLAALDPVAHRETKRALRGDAIARIREVLDQGRV